MAATDKRYVTLTLTVTVPAEDAVAASDQLTDAVGGAEFPDCVYVTTEAPASPAQAADYRSAFD